jgi:uncharacterized membrane protein
MAGQLLFTEGLANFKMRGEEIILTGITLIIIGFIIITAGILISLTKEKSKTNFAIGGFIGPIPFGFFSDKKMFFVWLLILTIFLIIWVLFRRIF